MSFADRLTGGVSTLALRQVVEFTSAVIAVVLLIRHFGPERYGMLALATAVIELAAVATGTFEESLRRYVPEYRATGKPSAARQLVLLTLVTRWGLGAVVAAAVFLGAPAIAEVYGLGAELRDAVGAAAPLVFAIGTNAVATSLLVALEQYRVLAVASLAGVLVALTVAALAPLLHLTVPEFLVLSAAAQILFAAVLLWWGSRGIRSAAAARPHAADRVELRRVWNYVWPLWGGTANYVLYQHASRLLLGLFAPVAVVGYFSVAKNVIERIAGLYYQLPAALLPALSERLAREGASATNPVVERLARWMMPLGSFLAIAVLCLSSELIQLLGGGRYDAAVPILAIFAAQLLFRLPASLWGTLYYLHERTRTLLWMNVARVVPLLVLLLLLIPLWGARGAAAAEAGSYAIALALFALHMPRTFSVPASAVVHGVARACLLLLLVAALVLLTGWNPLVRWALVGATPLLLVASGLLGREHLHELRSLSLSGRAARAARGVAAGTLERVLRLMGKRPATAVVEEAP